MQNLETFYGPNAGYVLDLYDRYKQDPSSVDEAARTLFATWSPDKEGALANTAIDPITERTPQQSRQSSVPLLSGQQQETSSSAQQISRAVAASNLAHAIRERGHLGAHLDPLGSEPLGDRALLAKTFGLTENDLAQLPPTVVGGHAAEGAANALEAINALRAMYSGTISYEFDQVKSSDERAWLRDAVGLRLYHQEPTLPEARR